MKSLIIESIAMGVTLTTATLPTATYFELVSLVVGVFGTIIGVIASIIIIVMKFRKDAREEEKNNLEIEKLERQLNAMGQQYEQT